MNGEFLAVWPEMWGEIWLPIILPDEQTHDEFKSLLANHLLPENFEEPEDLFSALYTVAYKSLRGEFKRDEYEEGTDHLVRRAIDLSEFSNDPNLAINAFKNTRSEDFESELAFIIFLERAFEIYQEYDELLAGRYALLVKRFIEKYSLRYEISDPFLITPTLPGIFTSLFQKLKVELSLDPHLDLLMQDYLTSLRDIRNGLTEGRVRHCIHNLVNLAEGISMTQSGVSATTLGEACKQIKNWPHKTLRDSLSKIYGFTSDYPGIRHAGNPKSKERPLDARDLVAVSVILTGYAPYISNIDCGSAYIDPFSIASIEASAE